LALSRRRAATLTAALTVAVSLVAAGPALGADHRLVKAQDDCDPVTFNAAEPDPIPCVGDGRTTLGELFAEFTATGAAKRWQFSRPEFNIDAGGTITATNVGGEFHSFTEVPAFGNGCVPDLNRIEPKTEPVVPCSVLATTGLPPGESLQVTVSTPGPHLFQCMIHPWMHSTVDVRARDNRGGGED
jgi:plastocyanin